MLRKRDSKAGLSDDELTQEFFNFQRENPVIKDMKEEDTFKAWMNGEFVGKLRGDGDTSKFRRPTWEYTPLDRSHLTAPEPTLSELLEEKKKAWAKEV